MHSNEIERDYHAADPRRKPEGPWLQVLGGVAFDLTRPTAAMIDFSIIATVLARIPRFAGHTEGGVYSVAQYSVEGARAILRDTGSREAAAAFAIHDAHEAYVGDIATPIQKALCAVASEKSVYAGLAVTAAIKSLKARIDVAIHEAAGIPFPLAAEPSSIVHEYDVRMMCTERLVRLAPPPRPWTTVAPVVVGCDLYPWSEAVAAVTFRTVMRELLPSLGGDAGCGPGARGRLVLEVDSQHES